MPETLPSEVLAQMGAHEKPAEIPVATASTLPDYDGIIFGTPTRFGMVRHPVLNHHQHHS